MWDGGSGCLRHTRESPFPCRFFDFARQRTIELGTLPGTIEEWIGGLTVSSGRRTIPYSNRTYQSNEVMLVEDFR